MGNFLLKEFLLVFPFPKKLSLIIVESTKKNAINFLKHFLLNIFLSFKFPMKEDTSVEHCDF